MQELIKIANNGQWTLEKARKGMSADQMEKLLADYRAKKEAPRVVAAPAKPAIPEGLRPASVGSGANPVYSKEQVAEMRARNPSIPDPTSPLAQGVIKPKAPQRSAADIEKEKHISRTQKRMEAQQAADDEKARARRGNQAAFLGTAKLLGAQGGEKKEHTDLVADFTGNKKKMGPAFGTGEATGGENKGWAGMAAAMEQRQALNEAHRTGKAPEVKKPEIQGPMEIVRDAQGNAVKQMRKGKFHGEGYRTRGKIVHKPVMFPSKQVDEAGNPVMIRKMVPQQEEHILAWDEPKQKWNHVKTVHVPLGQSNP